jgi:hypothetical protein
MITREEALFLGYKANREHQRTIGRITSALYALYKQGLLGLEPFSETNLNESEPSPVPDISLFDEKSCTTPVIIEVNDTTGIRNDLLRIKTVLNTTDFGVIEGFVYDFKRNEWHKYHRDKGDITDQPSFCEAINLDLATLL